MKINELTRSLNVWTSNAEKHVLESIDAPILLNTFDEREKTVIEQLVRKNLLIIVNSKGSSYVYPNR